MRAKVLPIETEGFDEVYRLDLGGAVAFVALHALIEGRSFGGIRVKTYDSERTAHDDALRLARAMSRKVVMAGLPYRIGLLLAALIGVGVGLAAERLRSGRKAGEERGA